MVKVLINDTEREFEAGLTVIQALELSGIQVPRFCYHEKLRIAGNCRMCLVEIAPGPPKPQASCAINIAEGMSIKTETEMVRKAREGVMEFLLANHPLDCPICDQGGECDLQDQAFVYGKCDTRNLEDKRVVEEKGMGPFIKTAMTRCIHCTRCVRFMQDIAGTNELGAFGRGNEMEIATVLNSGITSELSGNIIDLCPVGALTAKPYAFSYRKWELEKTNSIDVFDGLGSSISVQTKAGEVVRVLPRINDEINEDWISDKTRFAPEGLLNQRLDTAYIKNVDGKLVATSMADALDAMYKKIKSIKPSKELAILTGKFTDSETTYALTGLAKYLGTPYTENRDAEHYLDSSAREAYIFNSKIIGIDEADVIFIINSDVKREAPVLNARIRKNILERNIKVYYLGADVDLTYKTINLGNKKQTLNDILQERHELSESLKDAKKPMFIVGLDAFLAKEGLNTHHVLLEIAKKYLIKDQWNGFNVLHQNSSFVSSLDAGFIYSGGILEILQKTQKGEIKVVYAVGADEIDIKYLKDTFLIYQGSHGDRLAPYASIILPSTTYVEKVASFINTEGRLQKTSKATNPKGSAIDDSKIVSQLSSLLSANISNEVSLQKKQNIKDLILNIAPLEGCFVLSNKDFYNSDYISRNSKSMMMAFKEFSCGKNL